MRETVCIRSLGSFPHLGPLRTSHLWKLSLLEAAAASGNLAGPSCFRPTNTAGSFQDVRPERSSHRRQTRRFSLDDGRLVRTCQEGIPQLRQSIIQTCDDGNEIKLLFRAERMERPWFGGSSAGSWLQALHTLSSLHFSFKCSPSRCICPNMRLHGNQASLPPTL